MKVIAPLSQTNARRYGVAPSVVPSGLRVNGRGLAAADVDNDGRMEIAVNSIGGKLLLLKPSGPSGHWLDVRLSRFSPGAVVTLTLEDGRTLSQEVRAGSSYLSSEDPRVHFGLGGATRAVRAESQLSVGRRDRPAQRSRRPDRRRSPSRPRALRDLATPRRTVSRPARR